LKGNSFFLSREGQDIPNTAKKGIGDTLQEGEKQGKKDRCHYLTNKIFSLGQGGKKKIKRERPKRNRASAVQQLMPATPEKGERGGGEGVDLNKKDRPHRSVAGTKSASVGGGGRKTRREEKKKSACLGHRKPSFRSQVGEGKGRLLEGREKFAAYISVTNALGRKEESVLRGERGKETEIQQSLTGGGGGGSKRKKGLDVIRGRREAGASVDGREKERAKKKEEVSGAIPCGFGGDPNL